MDVINILDSQSANMIAAGEVVERPASAIKELIENAIDAGARTVSVEIKGGGAALMRVSDDGCGMSETDLPKSVLRHATSKIQKGTDIDGVTTLGFRGEALAAISAVSKLKIISRREGEAFGHLLTAEEGRTTVEEVGCPVGTTVLVEGLFYNTPARRKFLKKDATEAAACRSVVEKAAISNPRIAFRFTVDGEQKLSTDGDGSYKNAIADALGDGRAKDLIKVECVAEQVEVSGYVSAPSAAIGRNTAQNTFVNGRYVVSKTVQAAIKEAYRSFLPNDRYPVSVLFISVPYKFVDVNVHPAKTEIKFADERLVYQAVYYAVRGGLERKDAFTGTEEDVFVSGGDLAPVVEEKAKAVYAPKQSYYKETTSYAPDALPQRVVLQAEKKAAEARFNAAAFGDDSLAPTPVAEQRLAEPSLRESIENKTEPQAVIEEATVAHRYVGELYNAYIVVETEGAVYIIDKHAAHERILYEDIKKSKVESQTLLVGEVVELSATDAVLLTENKDYLFRYGFDIDSFGDNSVVVRGVPAAVKPKGLDEVLSAFAAALESGNALPPEERCDRALYTMACKAALKAGIPNDPAHNVWLVDKLFEKGNIKYCPHGRPIAKVFTRREADKWFDR